MNWEMIGEVMIIVGVFLMLNGFLIVCFSLM